MKVKHAEDLTCRADRMNAAINETASALEEVRKSLRKAGFCLNIERRQTAREGVFICVIRPLG